MIRFFPAYVGVYVNNRQKEVALATLQPLPVGKRIARMIYLNSSWTGNYKGRDQIVLGNIDLPNPVEEVTGDLEYSPAGHSKQLNEDVEWLALNVAIGDTVSLGPLRDPGIGGHQVRQILSPLSVGRWFIFGRYAGDPNDPGANSVHHFVLIFWEE